MSRRWGMCFGLAFLMLITQLSCGLKSSPRPAKVERPPRVKDLKGEWKDRELVLTGKLPGEGTHADRASQRWSARIYHAWFGPGHEPCEGCPVTYTEYVEKSAERAEDGEFVCRLRMDRDAGTHFFEVRLMGEKGVLGPPSDRVKISVESHPESAGALDEGTR